MSTAEVELRELCRDSGCRTCEPELVEDRTRQLEEPPRLLVPAAPRRHAARIGMKLRTPDGVIRELGRLLEMSLRLARRAQRRCALARPEEHLARLHLDLARVLCVRDCTVGVEVVRRQHLDDLVLVDEGRLQIRGRGEMSRMPLALRERLVRDVANEVLEEAVLAVLR